MDRFGEWRSVAPDEDEPEKATSKPDPKAEAEGKADQVRLYAVLAAVVLAITGVFIWLTQGGAAEDTGDLAINAAQAFIPRDATSSQAPAGSAAALALVVDVQGAVERPGVHRLDAGARIADAIAAAGGYSSHVDIARAAAVLNLAAPVADGAKVHVPTLGETPSAGVNPGAGATSGTGASGLINVNTATPDELDSLPGVGPVTAAKIIDARTEAPFAAVDDLLSRGVLGASAFESVRPLVSVGP